MDKYLSIITNFGCHYTCPYCIVKENNLRVPKTTIEGLDNVGRLAKENNCNWISISGGGDPLHNYNQNKDWYEQLFFLNQGKYKLELHTSYLFHSRIYGNFNRVVYHLIEPFDIKLVKRMLIIKTIIQKTEFIKLPLFPKVLIKKGSVFNK